MKKYFYAFAQISYGLRVQYQWKKYKKRKNGKICIEKLCNINKNARVINHTY